MNMFTEENTGSRREFLKMLGKSLASVTVVGFITPLVNSCSSATGPGSQVAPFNITVDVSNATQNNQAIRTVTPDGNSLLVVRQSATSYITLLLICTHQECGGSSMVLSGSTIICTCHDSKFNLSGQVTQGPAQTNLTTYSTVYDPTTKKVTVHN
jgi:Rieske Fe-S protein